MVFRALLSIIFISSTWVAQPVFAYESGCFARHLTEARALNLHRRPLYSAWTHGESISISDELISSEKWLTWFAYYYDARAEKFQKLGIPILCEDFMSMKLAPKFQYKENPPRMTLAEYVAPNFDHTESEIKQIYAKGSFKGVFEYLDAKVKALEPHEEYHCMALHVLKSLRRSAALAPIFEAQAKKLKKSTTALSWDVIRFQAMGLKGAVKLDQKSASLHSRGVPIVCQDIPEIPVP